MTNYKPHILDTITAKGVTITIAQHQTIIGLYEGTSGSGAPDSYLNDWTGADYSVPTGKTFKVVGVRILSQSQVTYQLWEAPTTDSISSAELKLTIYVGGLAAVTPSWTEYYLKNPISFDADKFLVSDPIGTGQIHTEIIGYEE